MSQLMSIIVFALFTCHQSTQRAKKHQPVQRSKVLIWREKNKPCWLGSVKYKLFFFKACVSKNKKRKTSIYGISLKKISRDCDVIPSSQYGSLEENDVNKQGQVFSVFSVKIKYLRRQLIYKTFLEKQCGIFGAWYFWLLELVLAVLRVWSPWSIPMKHKGEEPQ